MFFFSNLFLKKNIVHRNLTLENFIYDLNANKVFLIDFAHARHLPNDGEHLSEEFGAPAYLSPEMLTQKKKGASSGYLPKPADIWSIGVVLYTLLFGFLPFYDSRPDLLFKKIVNAEFYMPCTIRLSSQTRHLVQRIFSACGHTSTTTTTRPNIDEILVCLTDIMSEHV